MNHSIRNAIAIIALAFLAPALAAETPTSKALAGRWTNGRLSIIQYRDAYTGVDRPPSGNHFAMEFRPDGTYSYVGLIQNTLYNCTTTLFGEESGTYEVSESGILSVHPRNNPFKMTNSCAPSSNREAPGKLTERSYRFEIRDGRLQLKNLADGQAQVFQRDRQ